MTLQVRPSEACGPHPRLGVNLGFKQRSSHGPQTVLATVRRKDAGKMRPEASGGLGQSPKCWP